MNCERCKTKEAMPTDDTTFVLYDLCITCRVKIKRHFRKWLDKQVKKWNKDESWVWPVA